MIPKIIMNLDIQSDKLKSEKVYDSKMKPVDYDDLLSAAGKFGRYQLFLFFSTFPFYVFGVFVFYTQMFLTEVSPNHWCWVPELANLSELDRRALAIPSDNSSRFGYSQCTAYVANWTKVLTFGSKPNESWTTAPCQQGWEFNKTEIPYPTIASEMGWVCDKDSYQASAQSIFYCGSVVGSLLFGWIADRFGRVPGIVSSNMFGCVFAIVSTFSRNFAEFAATRFFIGMCYDSCMMMSYILVLEYVAPKYRSVIANLPFALFYSLAATILPWIVLVCGHWKLISLVTSIPMLISLLTPFVIPESPRWLLTKMRHDEAITKVLKIGRINRKEVPTNLIEKYKFSIEKEKNENVECIFQLMKRPLLRRMFIFVCLTYMCCSIVFDALVRSISQLDFDFFVSFSVISFTEFPSLLLISFILDITGRKPLVVVSMLTSSVFSFLTVLVQSGLPSVLCSVLARFAVNMVSNTAIQWAAEMFPTSVRGSGASIVHTCGYIATIISPFIAYLAKYAFWLPLVLVGIIAAIGASMSLFLPETANKDMPQTFDDAENLIKNQKFWEVPFLQKSISEEREEK